MKILCVTPYYYPSIRYGGPVFSLHSLNKALVKKGVEVVVYTTDAGVRGEVLANQELVVDGVKIIYFSFNSFFNFLGSGWQFSLRMKHALRDTIAQFDIVYLVVIWSFPVAAASYYCQKYKKPYIVSPRGMLYPDSLRMKLFRKLLYYFLITRKTLRKAAAIHYTTEDEQVRCHQFLGLHNRALMIPNGIDLESTSREAARSELRMQYPELGNKKVILFIGRITWKKRLDFLVKAFYALTRARADVHLLIVGDFTGRYACKIRDLIYTHDLAERVIIAGMVSGKRKAMVYAGSDVFVLPSCSESFGMTIIEAMMYGTPVVVTKRVGIAQEVIKHKAGVVVEPTVAGLYGGITSILDNEMHAQELSRNGRAMVEQEFAIERIADMMIQSFKDLREGRNDHSGH